MRGFLALLSMMLLGAGTPHATETSAKTAEVLTGAIAEAKLCEYTMLKVALDDDGNPKGPPVVEDKEGQNVLKKLASGDKNYLRAFNKLRGTVSLDTENGTRRIDASLAEEIRYTWKIILSIKLQELNVVLDQRLQEDKWLPTFFELKIKYWVGRGVGITVYEKYRAELHCD